MRGMQFHHRIAATALALAALPVHATDTARTAASLQRTQLMAAAFPVGRDRAEGRLVQLQLPKQDPNTRLAMGGSTGAAAIVSPLQVVRIDDEHAVLLTQAAPVGPDGEPEEAHAVGAWLGAYFFTHSSEGWTLSSHVDGVDYGGFSGELGKSKVERIAPHRYALVLERGSCWQGTCGTWMSVYELDKDRVNLLLQDLPLQASDAEASEACEDLLAGKTPSEELPAYECFDVAGHYTFAPGSDDAPGELHITFSGRQTLNHKLAPAVRETAVYRYGERGYTLFSGRNPTPEF